VGFFSKKSNKSTNKEPINNWNEDFKKGELLTEDAEQLGFNFNKYININEDLKKKGTKQGLRYNEANLSPDHIKILKNSKEENSAKDLREILKMTNATKFKNKFINPLVELGFFEMTDPEKPTSPNQKYRLTSKFIKKIT